MGGTSNASSLPRDCDSNSIIYCGGITPAELAQRYTENKTGDLPAIYSNFGLSSSDMTHADTAAKMGQVNKDGTVVVNGEVVATNALSIGRTNMPGSTVRTIAGHNYYQRPPSVSFASQSIAAYVFFDANGNFRAFVLTSCGNAGTATPKPKPVYKCDSLAATKISRTEFSFDAHASASGGAVITGYAFDFGDGKTQSSTTPTVSHTYAQPGTYMTTVTVSADTGTTTAKTCQVSVTVETPPPTPVFSCDSLTATQIDRTTYSFTGSATAEGGAVATGYTFDFGDGVTQMAPSPIDMHHTYTKDGTYTITMTVTVNVNGETKTVGGDKCSTQLTISPNECKPGIPVDDTRCTTTTVTPPPTPTELPHTGVGDSFVAFAGAGSLIAAIGYYVASRRGLLSTLLNQ